MHRFLEKFHLLRVLRCMFDSVIESPQSCNCSGCPIPVAVCREPTHSYQRILRCFWRTVPVSASHSVKFPSLGSGVVGLHVGVVGGYTLAGRDSRRAGRSPSEKFDNVAPRLSDVLPIGLTPPSVGRARGRGFLRKASGISR